MESFSYERAANTQAALALGTRAGASYLGGGTHLIDLMRETIARPDLLVDVTDLAGEIEDTPEGGLLIGAGVKNTAVTTDRRVRALSASGTGDPRGRFRPDTQHGDRWREYPATDTLHVFL
jgi:CO/xanthine dehydrogenase FAD-binding subunit